MDVLAMSISMVGNISQVFHGG